MDKSLIVVVLYFIIGVVVMQPMQLADKNGRGCSLQHRATL